MSNRAVVPSTRIELGWFLAKIGELLPMTPDPLNASHTPRPPGNLEREESQLWRWVLGFMVLLSFALAGLLWDRLENIPFHLRALPIGVLALSILFAVYAYGRRREVSELKGLLHGLQEHVGAAPDRKSTRLNSSHANISYAVFC